MPSKSVEVQSAEARFRQAFERLKAGQPRVLESGAAVTQNNVAKEAGRDPSALKLTRYPTLIREIQAYIKLHADTAPSTGEKVKKRRALKRSLEQRQDDAIVQRDQMQSILASANFRIVELTEEVRLLRLELDELRPPPTLLGKR